MSEILAQLEDLGAHLRTATEDSDPARVRSVAAEMGVLMRELPSILSEFVE
jgi:hypothetical protein